MNKTTHSLPVRETLELVPRLRPHRWRRSLWIGFLILLALILLAIGAHIGLVSWLRHRLHPLIALVFVQSLGQPDWVAGLVEGLLAGVVSPLFVSAWMASWLPGWRPDPWRRRSGQALGCLVALLASASLVRLVKDVDENGRPNHVHEVQTLDNEEAFDYHDGRARFCYETDGDGRIHLWPSLVARSPLSGHATNPATVGIIRQWRQQQRDAGAAQRVTQNAVVPTIMPLPRPTPVERPAPTLQVAVAPASTTALSPTPANPLLWVQSSSLGRTYDAPMQRAPTPASTPSSVVVVASPTPTPPLRRAAEFPPPTLESAVLARARTKPVAVVREQPTPTDDRPLVVHAPVRSDVYVSPPLAVSRVVIVRPPVPVYRTAIVRPACPPPRRFAPLMVPRFTAPTVYPRMNGPVWMSPHRDGRRFSGW